MKKITEDERTAYAALRRAARRLRIAQENAAMRKAISRAAKDLCEATPGNHESYVKSVANALYTLRTVQVNAMLKDSN